MNNGARAIRGMHWLHRETSQHSLDSGQQTNATPTTTPIAPARIHAMSTATMV